jgi:hypothetical protein
MRDQAIIYSLETGRGKRIAVLMAALVVVALVIWAVTTGFHGGHVKSSAAALAQPLEAPTAPVR